LRLDGARRVRALVAYDGTGYGGFQRQSNAPSVQEVLEAALERVTGEAGQVLGAGRTDAGVHAEGQVIAFDTDWRHSLADLERALNALLPADVAVRGLAEAAPGFHPRYDALSRRYRYGVYNAATRCPLSRLYRLHVAAPLDVAAMNRAAALLVGEHDFAAFGQPTTGDVTVRRVFLAEWHVGWAPGWLDFEIEANAFLYRMVRSIVGTLLEVGQGRLGVDEFAAILASRDRSRAGQTAPAHGLTLVEVRY
jgi:tRNA pseudouridine38-40 synthase